MSNCILCGKDHKPGTPCDWSNADSVWKGRLNIQPLEELEDEVLEEHRIEEIKRKRGRPRREC